ncbi:AraC family transcriptional regulator [Pseudomonas sp. N040]|uniref:AraC family transcriptional regulator n=1 Tax=Pseudomonas sp. N040 TaxID=2785325 RepID=UPI0018A24CF8|nr:AraC family transcriptional regulator [Pseudomonas sp. N040]MBF7728787.1 AraC family transcriptional regulator [Pseudomonas sp. N040]MBW7012427.1 AraC family transcriptional regulator [Pseudomonas sp. N040]
MPASPVHASVSASLTQAVLQAAERLGVARSELLAYCGLGEAQLADPDARIPLPAQQLLWQAVQARVAHPEPGLAIGLQLAPGPFSVLGYLLQCSPTLGAALETAQRYQRLVGEGGQLQVSDDGERLQLIYQPSHPGHPANRPRILALMACWVQWMRPLLSDFRLLAVRLAHAPPAQLETYQACFGCPLEFAAADYALVLPAAQRETHLTQANPALQSLLRQHAEALLARLPSESLSARVVALLSAQLGFGEPERAGLAASLQLSERTLQRRLAAEGSSYQQLLNDTRRQLAERHLRDGQLPAAEIALLLGYSEPSVFFRAFRQWTGLTPGEYRARLKP